MKEITMTVAGLLPEPQARPRTFFRGRRMVTYSPKTNFYNMLRLHALSKKPAQPLDGPLAIHVDFIFPRLASVKKNQVFKWTKPDNDNLLKATVDSLTQAKWWVDDGRLAHMSASKYYASNGDPHGVRIRVWQLDDPSWRE